VLSTSKPAFGPKAPDTLPTIAGRLLELVAFLRSTGAPREHVRTAEDAADLLDAFVTGLGTSEKTATCDEDPSPETADATWLGG
jgi:hypothetical protein